MLPLDLSPEVAAALAAGAPVVALESTIISHGFPYPANLAMARAVEDAVRAEGAIPATVALLGGRVKVGLTDSDLHTLAGPGIAKASLRDLPVLLATGRPGATTVAATAHLAALAGIKVFATGGIGGVHRFPPGHGQVWDVSADLTTLGQVDMVVVSAGAKSVLDIAATLEYLETLGVTVVGWRTDDFPGFYTRTTGHKVDARVETAAEVAAMHRARAALKLRGATLLVNPIAPEYALPADRVAALVERALAAAGAAGVSGRDITPFLLKHLHEATGGESVKANRELVISNARVAAQVAVALTREV
jgi:pseudouridine-5'-phosphate glycosidase